MKRFFHPTFPFRPSSFPFFYGWWILLVSSIGIVVSIPGQTMGFSVFTPILSKELELGSSMISTAYLIGTIASGLFLPQVGRLFDLLGARKLGTMVCVVMGLGLLYLSQVDRIPGALSQCCQWIPTTWTAFAAIAFGFFWLRFTAQGTLTLTSRSMLGKWFDRKRGIAISINGIVVSFSFSIAPKALDMGIETWGWRGLWAGLGVFMICIMTVFVWTFFRDNPEECELLMDGKAPSDSKVEKNEDLIIYRDFTRSEALKTASFWIVNLTIGLHSFVITGYTFHVVSIAESLGIEKSVILQAFVPASILGIGISLLVGWLSSRTQIKRLLAVLPLGGFLFCLTPFFSIESSHWLIIVGLGLSSGVFGNIIGLVWPRFFGRKNLGAIGGVNMATMVYSSAAAPLCYSLTYDLKGDYRPMFIIAAIVYAIAFFASFKADNPQRKLKPTLG